MLSDEMKKRLILFLEDDHVAQDVTTAFTPEKTDSRCLIKANEPATLAGVDEALFLFAHVGLTVTAKKNDGDLVHPGNIILEATGSNRAILSVERTALNVLGRMSGVATICRHAQQMAGANTKIALTRKTIPGFNLFDKKAAEIAGIWPHRLNLEDAVLFKENHLRFFASPPDAVLAASKRPAVKSGSPNGPKMVEIEVQTLEELKSAVTQKPDMVLLDNFSLSNAEAAVKWCRSNAPDVDIELSGGIRLSNLAAFAALKPDYISLGLLTKEARTVDFSLDFI